MGFPTFTLIVCILVLILVITASLAILYYIKAKGAYTYISPWCYTWQCVDKNYNPTKAYSDLLASCTPDPATGKIDLALCGCKFNSFYNPNNVQQNPPTTELPNNCISAT
jgi:hypothetical protein